MNKNIKHLGLFIAVILFFACQAVFAAEIKYPEIFGQKITAQTTTAGFAIYFFSLAVALGAVLVFVVIVLAGLDFVMAGGEPAKISSAKKKIMGAFIGLILLYSSYLILKTINPDLLNPKDTGLSCDNLLKNEATKNMPICIDRVKTIEGEEIKKSEMTLESSKNLSLADGEKIVIRKYDNVKEIWTFVEENYQGQATKLYDNKDASFPKEITNAVKSFKIIINQEGVYLYDKTGFGVEDGLNAPLFLNTSSVDLTNQSFFKKTKSIEIVAPRETLEKTKPQAIFFPQARHRGECFALQGNQITDLNVVKFNNVSFGYNLASVIIFNSKESEQDLGSVTFYTTKNCILESSGSSGGAQTEEIKECNIPITSKLENELISAKCGAGFIIKSFRITGPGGVVLINDKNYCQYWDSKDLVSGNCIYNIETSDVSSPNPQGSKPVQYMIFPVENK